ncbi:MAG: hypothetical protein HY053_05625 [Proteobacteria bacterium]|nr:hypothetical protein [Pseudomonadota bacterium]
MREVIELDPAWSHSIFQSFYILPERRGLYPNRVFVRKTGAGPELFFETNSWGLKGPEPDGTKPVLAVWGDSVVFGHGRSWVEMLNDIQSNLCALNGGLEGDDPVNILRRMWEANQAYKVDVNIYFPGWHARPGYACDPPSDWMPNPMLADILPKVIEQKMPGKFILCTVPIWLTPAMMQQDVPAYFHPEGNITDTYFAFWGNLTYGKDLVLNIYRYMSERNDIVRGMASKYGVSLIDLDKRFAFSTMEKIREYFFDLCHFRPAIYGELSQILLDELKRLKVLT